MYDVMGKFVSLVQKSAKLRAPRFTGDLAKSITVKPVSKTEIHITTNVPYAQYQETGFVPHWVSRRHASVNEWMKKKGLKDIGMFVSKYKPFMRPAAWDNIEKLKLLIKNAKLI
jgi:hypothetical protein